MSLDSFLKESALQGVELWAQGEQLRYRGPKAALTPDLLAEIKRYKAELLPLLANTTYLPLTYGQKALWFLHQSAPENTAYTLGIALRIRSPLDVAALRRALQALIDRHPALRTTFPVHHGEPTQAIHRKQVLAWAEIDARGWDEDRLRQQAVAANEAPFDLEHGPLLRACLFVHAQDDHILLLSLHHIISDGWSFSILVDELRTLYTTAQPGVALPPLKRSYADYVREQSDLLAAPEGERLWAYWRKQLAGELPLLNLPTDRPLPPVQRYRGAAEYFQVDPAVFHQIKELARAEGATLFATLVAAFQVLLYRYTGQEEIVLGTFADGRQTGEFSATVGYFVNPVAIRSTIAGNPPFTALLAQVRQTVVDALDHQNYPFSRLVEQLHLKRDMSYPPVFQAVINLMGGQVGQKLADFCDGRTPLTLGELALEPFPIPYQEGAFFLTLELWESAETGCGFLKYNTDLFDASTIARMVGHFQQLLAGIAANPSQPIAELPLLTPAERQQLLVAWNATAMPYEREQTIHQLFEAQVKRTPERVAVVADFGFRILPGQVLDFGLQHEIQIQNPKSKIQNTLTYGQLNARANQLAHYLRKLGVGSETLVGICVERSLDMVVGLLGILKAGGAYVPLDPSFPQERLAFMIEDAKPLVLITQQNLVEMLHLPVAAIENPQRLEGTRIRNPHVVCLDTDWAAIAQESEENTTRGVKPEHLAYVLYTSGSTGKPKGVQIEHRALTNFLQAMQQQPDMSEQDVLLAVTTISFDIAGLELYLPLITGAQLVLAGSAVAADGIQLLKLLNRCGATIMQATPATWRMLLAAGWAGSPQLKMLCGGEALPQQLADQLLEKGASLWNMYGPTETTIWSASCLVAADRSRTDVAVPIGRPIANTQLYILDAHRQPVPIGIPGELYIGGDGLARGYLNRPELTDSRFLSLDFGLQDAGDNPKLYRTGDLARYLPTGEIEFLGRIDNQVKVHGFRIELGEIEAVLNQHPAVAESVVVVREDPAGDKQLVAYVVMDGKVASDKITRRPRGRPDDKVTAVSGRSVTLSPPHPVTLSDLRDDLREKLPDYMIPSAFVFLKALPLTPNGKVDRRALPAVETARPVEAGQPLQTASEEALAAIWTDILGIKQVGRADNFFDLGGHSLRATQLIYRVQATFAVTLSIQQLFASPTVAGIAQVIERHRQTQPLTTSTELAPLPAGVSSCLVALQSEGNRPPFFCIHPLVGMVFPYYELASLLGAHQPFYGLQSVGVTGAEAPLTQIGAMARRYIDALRLIQPAGPYYLGGWSFGAYVAYEMARQLQQAGRAVALLTLIDTPPPSDSTCKKITSTSIATKSGLRKDRVIPKRQSLVIAASELCQLLIRDFDVRLIAVRVKLGLAPETSG